MIEKVLNDIICSADLSKEKIFADLYCGVGLFGIMLSDKVSHVIGIESAIDNLKFLKQNIEYNKTFNFRTIQGKTEEHLPKILQKNIDILMLDPPRKGIDKKTCKYLLKSKIRQLIYLSCNPATFARDLKILSEKYTAEKIFLYDFFPQTYHIETMAILKRID